MQGATVKENDVFKRRLIIFGKEPMVRRMEESILLRVSNDIRDTM